MFLTFSQLNDVLSSEGEMAMKVASRLFLIQLIFDSNKNSSLNESYQNKFNNPSNLIEYGEILIYLLLEIQTKKMLKYSSAASLEGSLVHKYNDPLFF